MVIRPGRRRTARTMSSCQTSPLRLRLPRPVMQEQRQPRQALRQLRRLELSQRRARTRPSKATQRRTTSAAQVRAVPVVWRCNEAALHPHRPARPPPRSINQPQALRQLRQAQRQHRFVRPTVVKERWLQPHVAQPKFMLVKQLVRSGTLLARKSSPRTKSTACTRPCTSRLSPSASELHLCGGCTLGRTPARRKLA